MLVDRYDRGNGFEWVASFTDVNGDVAEPDSVTLYVSYVTGSGRDTDEIEMTSDTEGNWSAFWDSSVSKSCLVYWSVRAVNPAAAKDGKFKLDANLANPETGTA